LRGEQSSTTIGGSPSLFICRVTPAMLNATRYVPSSIWFVPATRYDTLGDTLLKMRTIDEKKGNKPHKTQMNLNQYVAPPRRKTVSWKQWGAPGTCVLVFNANLQSKVSKKQYDSYT
jgi:hypothetical protein